MDQYQRFSHFCGRLVHLRGSEKVVLKGVLFRSKARSLPFSSLESLHEVLDLDNLGQRNDVVLYLISIS